MQSKKILLSEKIVQYFQSDVFNKEQTLIFLHGWGQDGKSFQKIFHILEENNISYISLDLPGFGSTELLSPDMTIEDYGAFVIAFIEKLSLEKPLLVGHSFGGRICVYLGSFYQNINKIILIGAAGIKQDISPLYTCIIKIGKKIFQFPGIQRLGDKLKNFFSSRDYRDSGRMEKIFKNTISNDLRKYMKDIKYEVLMIRGDQDSETPLSQGEIIHSLIKKSELHILKGTHFVFQEKSEETGKLILDFIGK